MAAVVEGGHKLNSLGATCAIDFGDFSSPSYTELRMQGVVGWGENPPRLPDERFFVVL